MKQSTIRIDARPSRSLLDEPPHELSRTLLEARFSLVLQVRHPWRVRRRDRLCDFMAIDAELRTWWVAAVDPLERLPVLLTLISDRKLARQAAAGDGVQLHCWSRKASGGLVAEIVELVAEDFTRGR
jgi:hypothetical protein